ncbi:MAG: GNAT family N-acetyltransferase [Burkholderiaceae bacterium]|jgi:phosphinothricin acetyltransferase|nr:GNAT family N-acetyltransferase [Burkholderiaceae bacterium]
MPHAILIRDAQEGDLPAITAIYAHHVLHGTGTFEIEPPTLAEITARRADVLAKGLPWLVADSDGQVLGYAYASWFKPRPAYRYSAEDSIYVRHDGQRRGTGRALLAELAVRCERLGLRKLIAVIGDTGNAGSIGLHQRLGFTHAGKITGCGWKGGQWLDIVLMERALGAGQTLPPEENVQSRTT